MSSGGRGARDLLVATAISGGTGYVIIVAAGAVLDAVTFTAFAGFWSAVYLGVSALTGVQQEFARATRPTSAAVVQERTRSAAPALVLLTVLGSVVVLTMAVVSSGGSGGVTVAAVVAAIAALAGNVLAAAYGGIAAGLLRWRLAAAIVALDGVIRLLLVAAALLFSPTFPALVTAIVLPFVITPLVIRVLGRSTLAGGFSVDVARGRLLRNILGTMLGATAMGVMISGYPFVLTVLSADDGAKALAPVLLMLSLVRAPIAIVMLSLQSFFIVSLRDGAGTRWRGLVALIIGGGLLVSVAAVVVGPPVVLAIFGDEYTVGPVLVGAVTMSGALVGLTCLSGARALAFNRHDVYALGWVAAAVAAALAHLLPLPLDARVALSLCLAPAIGSIIHVTSTRRR